MCPYSTSTWGLKLLVYEVLNYQCMKLLAVVTPSQNTMQRHLLRTPRSFRSELLKLRSYKKKITQEWLLEHWWKKVFKKNNVHQYVKCFEKNRNDHQCSFLCAIGCAIAGKHLLTHRTTSYIYNCTQTCALSLHATLLVYIYIHKQTMIQVSLKLESTKSQSPATVNMILMTVYVYWINIAGDFSLVWGFEGV